MGYYEGNLELNQGSGSGGFGADGGWWIIIVLLLFGWGRGGYGFGGGNGGGSEMTGYQLGRLATTEDLAIGFNNNAVVGSLNDIKLGQAGLQQTLCQGFNGVNTAILDCCCTTQRAIEGVNYNLAKSTCDIIQAGNANTQRLLDYMNTQEMSKLRTELAQAQGQLSQAAQTNNIISALKPIPQPAYVVPNPNCCYGAYSCGGTAVQ